MKKLALLIAFGVVLYVSLSHMTPIMGFVGYILRLVTPFLLGLCIAFILNVPMRFIENLLFGQPVEGAKGIKAKIRRPVSVILTLLIVFGIIAVVMFLVIPELARTLTSLANQIPGFLSDAQQWLTDLANRYPNLQDDIARLEINWQAITQNLVSFLQESAGNMLNFTYGAVTSVISFIINLCLGFVFSIYVLMQKEKLGRQTRKLLFAYLPEKRADSVVNLCSLSYKTFSSFLSGQCFEAALLGVMFFITLSVCRMPYALLISVLTAFTALIPIFGAIIAWVTGVFLIMLINPMQALWFFIIFQVLQQIEGNLIYPHVVGNSVGLPSIWVLVAVTIGGSLFGIVGMVIFIPLCSVLYTLLRTHVYKRLEKKGLQSAKFLPTRTVPVSRQDTADPPNM